jgi:phage repressor protein C with HTH and peptisase S24 domain
MLSFMNGKEFWSNVKSYLSEDINQQWLCKQAGISSSTLTSMITRGTMPKVDTAIKISNAIGVSLIDLLGAEPNKKRKNPTNSQKNVEDLLEEPTFLVPLVSQKISAGLGEDFLSESEIEGHVRILERMTHGIDKTSLVAAPVKGDSMTGVQIFDGDIVIFAQGHVSENGIYVISLFGEVRVKRLEFRAVDQKIYIHSENPRYSPESVDIGKDNLINLGKVVGWVHSHPY